MLFVVSKMNIIVHCFFVIGCFCSLGSTQYNLQPIPVQKRPQEIPAEVTPLSSTSTEPTIPLTFPTDNTTYPFVKNKTIEDILIRHSLDCSKNLTVDLKLLCNNTTKLEGPSVIPNVSSTESTIPLIFPTDNKTYPFVKNKTIEDILITHSLDCAQSPSSKLCNNETKSPLPKSNQNATQNESIQEHPLFVPPKVFPTDTTKYKFKTNKTTEDYFLNKNTNHVDTEVPDLLSHKHYEGEYDVDQINSNFNNATISVNGTGDNSTNKSLESNQISGGVDKHFGHNHLTNGKSHVAHGPLAGILIGVLLLVALVGYASLVLWRRSLEIKYGTRERLVNEEDFDPHYDNRFEL